MPQRGLPQHIEARLSSPVLSKRKDNPKKNKQKTRNEEETFATQVFDGRESNSFIFTL
jgi:hypothetical protein